MKIPPFLSESDKIGLVAPAKKVDPELLEVGIGLLEGWGLDVIKGNHVLDGDSFLAGKDGDRLEDLNAMIKDSQIKAIFCVRGGYGTGRILNDVNFEPLKQNPKWVIGFSDITLIHLKLSALGIASIHGPMPAIFHKTEIAALHELKTLLFGEQMKPILANKGALRTGNTKGEIVGGNLSMICHSLGTPCEINTDGKILILEEVGEPAYKIDRMLHQLKEAGKLSNLLGLLLGHFTMPDEEESYDFTTAEIIESLTKEYYYPVGSNLPIGHEPTNFPIPLGVPASLEVSENESRLIIKTN